VHEPNDRSSRHKSADGYGRRLHRRDHRSRAPPVARENARGGLLTHRVGHSSQYGERVDLLAVARTHLCV